MPCGEFSNTKLHRQQISVCIITQLFTIHDKAENLKIQHIISYLFVWTATYFLSTVTFDSIHCPAERLDWNLWEGHENTYLSNIYIHAQDGKNFREFSLKIKNNFRSTVFYFVNSPKNTFFSIMLCTPTCTQLKNVFLEFKSITSKIFLWHWFCIKTKMQ